VERDTEVWELQYRKKPFGRTWHYGHPGRKELSIKWAKIDGESFIDHPSMVSMEDMSGDNDSDVTPTPSKSDNDSIAPSAASKPPPAIEILGRQRTCSWEMSVNEETDADGWQYALAFQVESSAWTPIQSWVHCARRRRWDATFAADELDVPEVPDPQSPVSSKTSLKCDLSPSASVKERCFSTMMKERQLDTNQNAAPIFEANIGVAPLKLIGAIFSADDWFADATMTAHFSDLGARSLDIGPWARGGAATHLLGKVRSGEMIMPVPPLPMCPKETRQTVTYHVLATQTEVIFEKVTMNHDVPFGAYFNVVQCDRFTVDEASGQTIMTRYAAIEWFKSTWLEKQIQNGTKTSLKTDAEKFVDLLRRELPERMSSTPRH
jgi:hypothetical protein